LLITLLEYGIIKKSSDFDLIENTFKEVFLSDKTFELLKKTCFETATDSVFQYSVKQKKEQIQVKNYVGLIQLKDGTQLEILPKIADSDNISEAKAIFLKMLRCVADLPFKKLNFSKIQTIQNQPIFEVFISAFIDEVESIICQSKSQSKLSQR
jgi:5-methylcytosine-specific restriction enzyme subunit McrC